MSDEPNLAQLEILLDDTRALVERLDNTPGALTAACYVSSGVDALERAVEAARG